MLLTPIAYVDVLYTVTLIRCATLARPSDRSRWFFTGIFNRDPLCVYTLFLLCPRSLKHLVSTSLESHKT